jgi:type IV pilus assembly protein PilM
VADNSIAIGLDIDEKSIKFVKVKQINNEVTLLKFAVRDIPPAPDRQKTVIASLKTLFKNEKPDTEVYTCTSGANVSIKRINIPVMPDSEMPEAIRWEAKNIAPFPLENAALDFYKIGQITDKSIEKFDIMTAIASEEIMNFWSIVTKETGIKLAGITAIPFALSTLLARIKKLEKNTVTAVIDIGAEAASINLFKGDTLHFMREITVAGDSFTKAMTGLLVADHWQLNLTYDQAEEIKKKYGIPKKDTNEVTDGGVPLVHIFEMMGPTLRRLQNEILRSFDYYKEQFHEETIDKIILTGGSSCLKNLDDHLSASLGIKVEVVEPLEDIKYDPKAGLDLADLKAVNSRLTLALGLAIDRGRKINFLKSKDTPKKKGISFGLNFGGLKDIKLPISIKLPTSLSVWIMIIIMASAASYYVYLNKQRDMYKDQLASKQAILADVKALVERKTILEEIAKEESKIKDTLAQLTAVLPKGVILTELMYDNSKHQLWISGIAPNTKTVGQLVKDIEASPNFNSTILIEARKAVVDGVSKANFKITFALTL